MELIETIGHIITVGLNILVLIIPIIAIFGYWKYRRFMRWYKTIEALTEKHHIGNEISIGCFEARFHNKESAKNAFYAVFPALENRR